MTFNNAPFAEPCRVQISGWTCTPTPIQGGQTGETWCRHDTGECYGIPCCGLPKPIANAAGFAPVQSDDMSAFALVAILMVFLVRSSVAKIWHSPAGPELLSVRTMV
jgi:hypothetical protein